MIDKRTARSVLDAALETGGDFSELYIEDSRSHSILMTDLCVEDATYAAAHGAGVRVFSGLKSAYAYTNATDRETLISTARAAAAALKGDGRAEPASFLLKEYGGAPEVPFSDVENESRIRLLRDASKAAKSYSGYIKQISARYMDVDKHILVCNSLGVWAQDQRPRTRLSIQVTAADNDQMQTGVESPGFGMGFEAYRRIDGEAAALAAAKSAVTMLTAPQCPPALLPVVIDGGFGGVIFHEACGHSLEATAVAKGNSEFADKLGQRIASERVTAVDDGTLPGEWGTIGVDDEGTPSRRNVLIERGVLRGYLIDLMGARRMGMEPTGNARRQSYAYAPTSRMTNTFIEAGTDDEEEMIRSLAEGLFAKKMGGGSVNPLTGEFNFAVTEGYWVKNGQIVTPVRGATLVGRGAEVLLRIDRVGKDRTMGQGMCGSLSGSVPANVGQPRIRVDGITIGGKGEKR
ncbi:MAG: TldD/PmbA family protein [Bacillota bacterium]